MNNKEREREELHKTIWKIANELRGSVDGWDFKQYVLGLLFYRFISENIENYVNENQRKAGITDFQYRNISDEEALLGKSQILDEKGFFILPSELFCNIRKGADKNENLNVVISNVFNNIEASARGTASEDDVKGLFDDFTIDNKLGNTVDERNEKLVKLLNAIGDLNFGDYTDNSIDLFGDTYEFLMTMYASSAGKSGGEFFTPQEVGELLAKIITVDKKTVNKVYDPACGSGGLLLKFAKELGKDNVIDGFYGQELNLTTYNLARINMFLHNINYNKFNIERGDTLIHPAHWNDEPFDAIVSNPPYSTKWVGKSNPVLINDARFAPAGVLAPESRADLAFVMHILSWLSSKGTAAIVEFPGALYREDNNQEPAIRKFLVDNNYIDTIIQLSGDMFFGTNSATCILVLKKNKTTTEVHFIDASDEKIVNKNRMKKATNKYKLSDENINNIIRLYKDTTTCNEKNAMISYEKIKENNYNLSINLYLKNQDKELSVIDIDDVEQKLTTILDNQNKLKNEIDLFVKEYHSKIKSEIKSLLKEDEIKYVTLESVCDVYTGGEAPEDIIKDNKPSGEYIYPLYSNGTDENSIYGYSKTYRIENDAVTVSSIGTIGYHTIRKGKFTPVIRLKTLVPKDNNVLNIEYLNYIFDMISFVGTNATLSSMNSSKIKKMKIALPNIEIQKYIVEHLKKFDGLLEALKKELSYREDQATYYKNSMLSFKELVDNE